MKHNARIDHFESFADDQDVPKKKSRPVRVNPKELILSDGPVNATLDSMLSHPDVDRVTVTRIDIHKRRKVRPEVRNRKRKAAEQSTEDRGADPSGTVRRTPQLMVAEDRRPGRPQRQRRTGSLRPR